MRYCEFFCLSVLLAGTLASSAMAGAIALTPDTPIVIRKLQPVDCRLVRGITHGPVDGRTDTRYANGIVTEWRGVDGAAAINYRLFNGNNGLHVTFADGASFDAIQTRGPWQGAVYLDSDTLTRPSTKPLLTVAPDGDVFRHRLPSPIQGRKLSFFYDEKGGKRLSDLSVLRVTAGKAAIGMPGPKLGVGGVGTADEILGGELHRRFGDEASVRDLAPGAQSALKVGKGLFVHFMSGPQAREQGLAAVTLSIDIKSIPVDTILTFRIQDVLDPRRENMGVDVVVPGPGRYQLTLDMPDQVFLPEVADYPVQPRLEAPLAPEPVVWVSLGAEADAEFAGLTVQLHTVPRVEALVEAAAWRKFLLRSLFTAMSEPRPWMHLQDVREAPKPTDTELELEPAEPAEPREVIRKQITENSAIRKYEMALLELLETAEITRLLLPEDDVVREYHEWLYQNIDRRKPQPPAQVAMTPGAPAWASLIRSNWIELAKLTHWWLDHRMVANGELGGGIGDDSDMAQVWQCLPMIESAPLGERMRQQGLQLTDLLLAHKLEEGINRRTTDALHAYEDGINQLALNAWWFYGDPVHMARLMTSARTVIKLMHETADGRLHFPSKYVGIKEAREGYPNPPGATVGTFSWGPERLLLHPLYVVSWYNRNPTALGKFSQWGQTWMDYQKPGAFVDKVDIPTGKPIRKHSRLPPSANVSPVEEFLGLFQVTRDTKWHASYKMAIGKGFTGAQFPYGRMPHALVDWEGAAAEYIKTRCRKPNGGYAGFFIHKDRSLLTKWLTDSAAWFQRFPHMHTAAEQKTDRVITHNATTAMSCYLGDAPNRNRWLNFCAVSYEGFRGEDYAALVWDAGSNRLRVALYNFRDQPLVGKMRVWRLEHGLYTVRHWIDADDSGSLDENVAGTSRELRRYDAISLKLLPKQVTVVDIRQEKRLDDIVDRADVALSPIDCVLAEDGVLTFNVHNIGSQPARNVGVQLQRGGKRISEQRVDLIEAPLDLKPRMVTLQFKNVEVGDVIVVDPEQQIPEIAEHNNRIVCGR